MTNASATPLRIGILGAARIADDGIVDPAKVLGHDLVAVAARDRDRAEAFAAERGVAKVHDTYQDVIDDPDVEVVYDALVNSLHARWNVAALQAGKHVLSEKPITSNSSQARALREVAAGSPGRIVEGFHYLHHPVHQRLRELVTSGELGALRRVEIVLAIPAPADSDPRWSWELAGGATMDLGCYVLNAARQFGRWIGANPETPETPELVSADATVKAPEIDAAMHVELDYGAGVTGSCTWDMDAARRTMTWTVVGSQGAVTSPAYAVPHLDNRLVITRDGRTTEETLGDQTSYTYQLAHLADTLRDGAPFLIDMDDSVSNAELIDACYRRAGLSPRGT
ncbi:MAG: Gfo/Idh/MocA family protein [Streptosporangiaceae bacterium]